MGSSFKLVKFSTCFQFNWWRFVNYTIYQEKRKNFPKCGSQMCCCCCFKLYLSGQKGLFISLFLSLSFCWQVYLLAFLFIMFFRDDTIIFRFFSIQNLTFIVEVHRTQTRSLLLRSRTFRNDPSTTSAWVYNPSFKCKQQQQVEPSTQVTRKTTARAS